MFIHRCFSCTFEVATYTTLLLTVLLDNQVVIQYISQIKSLMAQQVLEQVHTMANRVARQSWWHHVKLKISWMSGPEDIVGNKAVDAEAKEASGGNSNQNSELPIFLHADQLPHSVAATQQTFKADLRLAWKEHWKASVLTKITRINKTIPSKSYHLMTMEFTYAQTTLITQLRTGHILLQWFTVHKVINLIFRNSYWRKYQNVYLWQDSKMKRLILYLK
jgi:hypothetical protein